MLQVKDYVRLDCIGQFEFGFVLTEDNSFPVINVTVIDHGQFMVRSLGPACTLEDAFKLALDCIQKGFYMEGLLFIGFPSYTFKEPTNIVTVR